MRRSKTFRDYIEELKTLEDYEMKTNKEYGSTLILGIMEEVGEIARAYLAEHGKKPTNIRVQKDETYKQELGDLLASIIKLAAYKNINLDKRLNYTLNKIRRRKKLVRLHKK